MSVFVLHRLNPDLSVLYTNSGHSLSRIGGAIGLNTICLRQPLFVLCLCIVLGVFAEASFCETLMLHGVKTEVYFSPKGGAEDAIVRTIRQARQEICVLAYSFTSAPVNTALEDAHARGAKVRVVLDKSQITAKGGKLQSLTGPGFLYQAKS